MLLLQGDQKPPSICPTVGIAERVVQKEGPEPRPIYPRNRAKDYHLPRRSAFTATNATQRRWRFGPPGKENRNHFGAVASVVAMIADAIGSGVDVARFEGSRGRLRLRSVIYRGVR
jgi:hypothetical protein